jgi:hypothetical protein
VSDVIYSNGASLPSDPKYRKTLPIATGVLDYFPAALAEVAKLSRAGNEKHNPGQPLHHARGKSSDHADCIIRHLIDRGHIDTETGLSHSVNVAWRALALLQEELEAAGAPLARGARPAKPPVAAPFAGLIAQALYCGPSATDDGDQGASCDVASPQARAERALRFAQDRQREHQKLEQREQARLEMLELHRSHDR